MKRFIYSNFHFNDNEISASLLQRIELFTGFIWFETFIYVVFISYLEEAFGNTSILKFDRLYFGFAIQNLP